MKRMIAGAALITMVLGTAPAALAETATTTPTTQTTTATTGTTATTDTTTAATTGTTATTDTTAAETTATTATTATTVDASLPQVTLTPDKLFYGLKLFIEKIELMITSDAAEKAALLEEQAQTRLAEAKAMADAGKADLAQQALTEAQAKMEAAQAAITAAAKTNKDLSKITAQIDADQVRFANAISDMLAKAPETVKAQVEPMVADLLTQVAAAQDAAKQDDQAKEEAEKLTEQADLKDSLEEISPRTILVLNAMAKASGKSLEDVVKMYLQNPGLGRIAHELGLSMGSVQHAAQIEWKKAKAGVTIQLTTPAAQTETQATTDATATQATAPAAGTETQAATGTTVTLPGLSLELKNGKGHEKKGEEHGKKGEEHGKKGENGHKGGKND